MASIGFGREGEKHVVRVRCQGHLKRGATALVARAAQAGFVGARRGGRRHMKEDSNISATESDQTDNTPLRGGETKAILIDRQTRCPPYSLNECSKILLSRIGLADPEPDGRFASH